MVRLSECFEGSMSKVKLSSEIIGVCSPKKTPQKVQRVLIKCPRCDSMLREDHLSKHIKKVHLKKVHPSFSSTVKQLAKGEICRVCGHVFFIQKSGESNRKVCHKCKQKLKNEAKRQRIAEERLRKKLGLPLIRRLSYARVSYSEIGFISVQGGAPGLGKRR